MLNPVRDIEPLWDWVATGLADVKAKCGATWDAEEIRNALVLGKAQLFTWGHDDGFCVLQVRHDRTPVLFIWALWGPGQYEECHEAIFKDLDTIAKGIGAAVIEIDGRAGWKAKGFRVVRRIMQRQVW